MDTENDKAGRRRSEFLEALVRTAPDYIWRLDTRGRVVYVNRPVSGDRGALGYFGHAYYVESPGLLKLVAIDAGNGCVLPSYETISSGEYRPLTRPLFLYVDGGQLGRQDVVTFMRYYLSAADRFASDVGYVPVAAEQYDAALSEIEP